MPLIFYASGKEYKKDNEGYDKGQIHDQICFHILFVLSIEVAYRFKPTYHMSNVTLNIEFLQKEYPKTWKDFDDFQKTLAEPIVELKSISFLILPYEWQLGVFMRYFLDSGIELDVSNAGYENTPALITEAFHMQENNISHYS